MPLDKAPPRSNRFGSPLVLSPVHWVRPEMVVEVKYLIWTADNLLRQVVCEGAREGKDPASRAERGDSAIFIISPNQGEMSYIASRPSRSADRRVTLLMLVYRAD